MKKFIVKLLFFAFVVTLVDCGFGIFLEWMQHKSFERNPERFEVRTMYAVESGGSEIAIIGASDAAHGYISNMIADSSGMTTYNYGKDGSFFIYQICLINLMLERYSPKVILWEIGKDCLSDFEAKNIMEWQSINSFYPYYDHNEFVKEIIDKRGKFQRFYMYSSLYRYNSQLLSMAEPFFSSEVVPDTKGYLPIETGGYLYPQFIDQPLDYNNVNEWKVELLRTTLNKCQLKGVKVIFCFAPKFKNEHIEGTLQWKMLREISREFNVQMIDYLNTTIFDSNETLFKDNVHLNDRGAKLYMEYFIPKLLEIIYN